MPKNKPDLQYGAMQRSGQNRKIMSFQEFQDLVKEEISGWLPEEYQVCRPVIYPSVRQDGSTYTALSLLDDSKSGLIRNIAPVVNLEEFYEKYRNCHAVELLLGEMKKILCEKIEIAGISRMNDYEFVREHLFLKAFHYRDQDNIADKAPIRRIGSYILTANVYLDVDESTYISGMVSKDVISIFGITEEELFEDAMKNSPRILEPQLKMVARGKTMFRNHPEDWHEEKDPLNTILCIGAGDNRIPYAAPLFYPKMMRWIASIFDSGYYVIPFSEYQMLLVDDPGEEQESRLESFLGTLDASRVDLDRIQYYDMDLEQLQGLDMHAKLAKEKHVFMA